MTITFQTSHCEYRHQLPDGKVACLYSLQCPQQYQDYDQRAGIGYWIGCKL